MICIACGAEIVDSAKYCLICGSPQNIQKQDGIPSGHSRVLKEKVRSEEAMQEAPGLYEDETGSGYEKEKKHSPVLKWIIVSVSALFVLGIVFVGIITLIIVPIMYKQNASGKANGTIAQSAYTFPNTDSGEEDTKELSVGGTENETNATELNNDTKDIRIDKISLSTNVVCVFVGESVEIELEIMPRDISNPAVQWESADKTIATVDSNGEIVGQAFGTTMITCSAVDGSGENAECEVMVAETPEQGFVAHLYKECLSRSGSTAEILTWADIIESGNMTPNQVAIAFIQSDEFNQYDTSNEEYIKTLYWTFLDREYDQTGYNDWLELLESGASREEVSESIAYCTEFTDYLIRSGLGEYIDSEMSDNVESDNTQNSEYILENSSIKKITQKDLEGFTALDCRLARNEIYARHGRKFDDEELQDYFNSCSWYKGTIEAKDFDESILNDIEKQNLIIIVVFEKENGYRE